MCLLSLKSTMCRDVRMANKILFTLLSDTGLCEPFVIGLDDPLQYFLSCVCQSGKPRWPPTQDKVLTWSLWEN